MKKICLLILALAAVTGILSGCGCTAGTTTPNTTATVPSTTQQRPAETTRPTVPMPTMPSEREMIPGTEDTIDPSNGADNGMVDPTAGANENARHGRRRPMGY